MRISCCLSPTSNPYLGSFQKGRRKANGTKIWAEKKTFPEKFHWTTKLNKVLVLYNQTSENEDKDLARQDLWSTLHLVLGRLNTCRAVNMANSLKDPRGALPPDMWIGFQQEVGLFPSRVAGLIKALSGDQFPSFQELLKIFCGGNLSQTCSVCRSRMSVAAVLSDVEGNYSLGIPTVSILPFLPPMFNCGAQTCRAEIVEKENAFVQLNMCLGATETRLQSTRCDYCFMLAEKVHR